jgi:hypothetical protein
VSQALHQEVVGGTADRAGPPAPDLREEIRNIAPAPLKALQRSMQSDSFGSSLGTGQ